MSINLATDLYVTVHKANEASSTEDHLICQAVGTSKTVFRMEAPRWVPREGYNTDRQAER